MSYFHFHTLSIHQLLRRRSPSPLIYTRHHQILNPSPLKSQLANHLQHQLSSKMMDKIRIQQASSLLAIAIIATAAAAAAAAFGTASGATYTVGEPGGSWDLRTNLTAWASTIAFHPDDQLLFKYDASAHDVVEVTQAGYRSCSAASPVGSAALRTGNDAVRLDGGATRRRRYFICSTPGHCAAGMKLEVRVVTDDDAECTDKLPPPGPAPPGAPSGITICSGGPPVVISTPGVVSYGAAPRSSSSAGLGTVLATVVMASLMLIGLAIV